MFCHEVMLLISSRDASAVAVLITITYPEPTPAIDKTQSEREREKGGERCTSVCMYICVSVCVCAYLCVRAKDNEDSVPSRLVLQTQTEAVGTWRVRSLLHETHELFCGSRLAMDQSLSHLQQQQQQQQQQHQHQTYILTTPSPMIQR